MIKIKCLDKSIIYYSKNPIRDGFYIDVNGIYWYKDKKDEGEDIENVKKLGRNIHWKLVKIKAEFK